MLGAGTRINRYEVTAPIGAGGAGAVYKARDVETAEEVALKVLLRVSPSGARRFLEEASALSRARHPGVVRILSYGVASKSPYCAMDFVAGETLWEWLHGAAPGAGARASALGIIERLCETLAFLHGQGIVHGDVKPRNVIVTAGRRPCLVDFGIASFGVGANGREVAGLFAAGAGTRAYSAPERLRGLAWDARADLYSLGCILHELVAGAPPRAPGEWAPDFAKRAGDSGLPETWSKLVCALLSPEPRLRPAYAEDVLQALRGCRDALSGPRSPVARPRRLHRPRLKGREAALRRIEARLDAAATGEAGAFVVITGESGMGKTRLLSELVSRAPVLVLISDAVSHVRLAPEHRGPLGALEPLVHALAALWNALDEADRAALRGPGFAWVAEHEPGLLPLTDPVRGRLPALAPHQVREVVFEWFERALAVLARDRGLLFIVDDLQWIDEPSLEILSRLARSRVPPGVSIVCASRPEASPLVSSLAAAPMVHREHLDGLTQTEIASLTCDLLGRESVPAPFARGVAERTRGNPFVAAQLLGDAAWRGALVHRGSSGWAPPHGEDGWALLELRASLPALVAARLADSSPPARRLLEAASVLGMRCERTTLAATLGWSEARFSRALRELRRRQLMDDTADERVYFVHDSFREAILASLTETARALWHARAFAAIRPTVRARDAPLGRLLDLANHARRAEKPRFGVGLLRRCALRLARLNALDQGIALLERALALEETGARRPRARAELGALVGSLKLRLGLYDDAEERLTSALAEAPRHPRARARLARTLGKVLAARHHHERARSLLEEARGRLGTTALADAREWLSCSIDLFWIEYFRDDRAAMAAALAAIGPVADARGSRAQRASVCELLALSGLRRERYRVSRTTVTHAEEAHRLSRNARDPLARAQARFQLGLVRLFSAEPARARPELERALRDGRAYGDTLLEARCLTYLSVSSRREGALRETVRVSRTALRCAEAAGLLEYTATARANLAWVALHHGSHAEVREHAGAALATWGRARVAYPLRWLASLPLLSVSLSASEDAASAELARDLLSPGQMVLPDSLVGFLEIVAADLQGGAARASSSAADRVRALHQLADEVDRLPK